MKGEYSWRSPMCIAKTNKGHVLLKGIEKSRNLFYVIKLKLSDPFFAAAEQSERKGDFHIKITPGKQPAFRDATMIGFAAQWRQRNERRDSLLMTCHYSDLGSASDWLKQITVAARPIRSATQTRVVSRHQYGISALVPQTSFRGETSDGIAKCRLFSQALQKQWTVICTWMWKSQQMYRFFFSI